MAKFPYTISGTRSTDAQGNIVIDFTVKDGNGTTRRANRFTFPPATPASMIYREVKEQVAQAVTDDFLASDIPASFSLSWSPADLF